MSFDDKTHDIAYDNADYDGDESFEAPDITSEVSISNPAPVFVGTYSHVFKGVYRTRMVAIKVLRALPGSFRGMNRKVVRERRIWGKMRHPNIVPLYGYTEESDMFGPFGALISPWYSNGDAGHFLSQHGTSLTLEERIVMWGGVVNGVCYLHNHVPIIVHGDIKPGNILIDENRNARICDFGLAHIFLEEGHSGMTTTSQHTGTERYLAYEMIILEDDAKPTTASDVWALGCVGLEFLFLQSPYSHRKNNRLGLIFQDIRDGIPPAKPPMDMGPKEWGLWSILRSCWNLDPDTRAAAASISASLSTWKADNSPSVLIDKPSKSVSSFNRPSQQPHSQNPSSIDARGHIPAALAVQPRTFGPPGHSVRNITQDEQYPVFMLWPEDEPLPSINQIRPPLPPMLRTARSLSVPPSQLPVNSDSLWTCGKCAFPNWYGRKVCANCYPQAGSRNPVFRQSLSGIQERSVESTSVSLRRRPDPTHLPTNLPATPSSSEQDPVWKLPSGIPYRSGFGAGGKSWTTMRRINNNNLDSLRVLEKEYHHNLYSLAKEYQYNIYSLSFGGLPRENPPQPESIITQDPQTFPQQPEEESNLNPFSTFDDLNMPLEPAIGEDNEPLDTGLQALPTPGHSEINNVGKNGFLFTEASQLSPRSRSSSLWSASSWTPLTDSISSRSDWSPSRWVRANEHHQHHPLSETSGSSLGSHYRHCHDIDE